MRENCTYGSMRGQGRGFPLLALLYWLMDLILMEAATAIIVTSQE